jgi:hypothetical protein
MGLNIGHDGPDYVSIEWLAAIMAGKPAAFFAARLGEVNVPRAVTLGDAVGF